MSSKIGRPSLADLASFLTVWLQNSATTASSGSRDAIIAILRLRVCEGRRPSGEDGKGDGPRYLRPQLGRRVAVVEAPVEHRVGHGQFAHPTNELRDGVFINWHLAIALEQVVEVAARVVT